MAFSKLSRIMPSFLGKSSALRRGVEAATVVEAAQKAVGEEYPPEIATHLRVVSYKAGTLKVTADRSVYASAARMKESELLARLNNELGENAVKKIVIS